MSSPSAPEESTPCAPRQESRSANDPILSARQVPASVSGWSLAALLCAVLSLLLAPFLGVRWPTVTSASLGLATGVMAVFLTRKPQPLALRVGGALVSAAVLTATVFAPGVLNSYWTMDAHVPVPDPNRLLLVPHDQPDDAGRPMSDDDWAEATVEGIRQDDLFIRIDSVKAGRLPERGATSYLLVNLDITQRRPGRKATFERYAPGRTEPLLTDATGRSYAFVVDRVRKEPTIFDVDLKVDHLLVFELPPSGTTGLRLELPASAWGRNGVCRFRIADVEHVPTPDMAREVARYKAMLRAPPREPPDPALGRALFTKTCYECHTLFGSGGTIGPDLTKSKRDDFDFLVTSIVDPSAVIDKAYLPTLVTTTTGLSYNGIVKHADADTVTLLIPNRLVVVPRKIIEEMRDSKVSLMPTELLKEFSEHEVRSLVAYLTGREQTPLLATPENAPYFFFNRQDLGNWQTAGSPWRLEDGELVPPAPREGKPAVIVSNLVLAGDFHLTLRFRPGKDGHGAVQVRDAGMPDQPAGPRVVFAVGQPIALAGADGGPGPEADIDSWNKLEIIAAKNAVTVRLNDRDAGTLTDPRRPARRTIAVEGPGVSGSEIRLRYLDLRVPIPQE
jgi:putative heme-binding domain-containing protein